MSVSQIASAAARVGLADERGQCGRIAGSDQESTAGLVADFGNPSGCTPAGSLQSYGRRRSSVQGAVARAGSLRCSSGRYVRVDGDGVSEQLVAVDAGDVVGEVPGASCVRSGPAELERLVEQGQPALECAGVNSCRA